MSLTDRLFCAWRWLRNRLPCFTWNRCCAEWELGRIEGQRQVGITRDSKGRFKRYST